MSEETKAVIAAEVAGVKEAALGGAKDIGVKVGNKVAEAVPKILAALAKDTANPIDDAAAAILGPKIEDALKALVAQIH